MREMIDKFWKELDDLGEQEVRKRLAAYTIRHPRERRMAVQWLNSRDKGDRANKLAIIAILIALAALAWDVVEEFIR